MKLCWQERTLRAQKGTHQEDRANMRPTQDLGQALGTREDWLEIWTNESSLLGRQRETCLGWGKPRNGVLQAPGQGLS